MEVMGALLAPYQLGYGTPHGPEAAVHAARIFLQNLQPGHLILKLDFRNAFNSVRRDRMLLVVKEKVPEIYPLIHSAYSRPSSLFFGMSSEGIQQGDPLGPLLFCLAIHSIVQEVHSAFRVFYLDDGTLGGSVEEVLHDLSFVERSALDLGLHLSHDKSELICADTATRDAILSVAPSLRPVDPCDATLLGSPIASAAGVDRTIRAKKEALDVLGGRLQHLYAHDALCLLRHICSLPKMLYTLRTSPCFLSPELELFDQHRPFQERSSLAGLKLASQYGQAALVSGV